MFHISPYRKILCIPCIFPTWDNTKPHLDVQLKSGMTHELALSLSPRSNFQSRKPYVWTCLRLTKIFLAAKNINRAFACDVMAAMLVYLDKRIFNIFFWKVHQHGRQLLCCFNPQGLSENALHTVENTYVAASLLRLLGKLSTDLLQVDCQNLLYP